MTNRKPKSQAFTNLSKDPTEQAAEMDFASRVEDLLANAGVPSANQIHILSQALQDVNSSNQG